MDNVTLILKFFIKSIANCKVPKIYKINIYAHGILNNMGLIKWYFFFNIVMTLSKYLNYK